MAALVVTQRAVRKKAMGPESKGMGIWLIFLLLSGELTTAVCTHRGLSVSMLFQGIVAEEA